MLCSAKVFICQLGDRAFAACAINATKLSSVHSKLLRTHAPFTKIVFNFPHVGGLHPTRDALVADLWVENLRRQLAREIATVRPRAEREQLDAATALATRSVEEQLWGSA